MKSLHINQLHARYYLSDKQNDQKNRLDSLLAKCTESVLPVALEKIGIDKKHEIAIRNIHVPMTFSLDMNDSYLIDEWGKTFALKIKQAIDKNDHTIVANYSTRLNAMLDFSVHVSLSSTKNNWVWRQIDFANLHDNDSIQLMQKGLVNALAKEHYFIMPVVRYLIRTGLFQKLIAGKQSKLWMDLVHILAAQTNIDLSVLAKMSFDLSNYRNNNGEHRVYLNTGKMLEISKLESVIDNNWTYFKHNNEACLYIVVLMLILTEPNLFSRSKMYISKAVLQVVADLKNKYYRKNYSCVATDTSSIPIKEDVDLAYKSEFSIPDKNTTDTQSIKNQLAKNTEAENILVSVQERQSTRNEQEKYFDTKDLSTISDLVPVDNNTESFYTQHKEILSTRYGGLLFLVNVLRNLDIYKKIANNELLKNRATGWVLQAVAINLISIELDEPMLKLFCGINPSEQAYWDNEQVETEIETELIKHWCQKIIKSLHQAKDWSLLSDKELLKKLCLRNAKLRIEPGWVDVYFDINTTDISIRKLGLDLDPGYEPILGFVINFHYE